MTLRKLTWTSVEAIRQKAYSAKLLRFLPASALFVNNVFLHFLLILKNLSQTNKSYFICRVLVSPCSTVSHSLQTLSGWIPTMNKPLLEMHSYFASVLMCNVAALTFMQLFMKTCVVAVFLKRHVRTWYCNRCLYCVNSYVLSSVLISAKPRDKGGFFGNNV